MRASILALLLTAAVLPGAARAQPAGRDERGAYLTVFRSPATGIEVRAGHGAAYAGFYPTVIARDGGEDEREDQGTHARSLESEDRQVARGGRHDDADLRPGAR
jgi:hypothetical protein